MRRSLLATILAALLLLSWTGAALAAGSSVGRTVPMQGQASVDQSGRIPQLQLSADAADGSGYHLEIALSPTFGQNGRGARSGAGDDGSGPRGRQGGRTIDLAGQFALSGPGIATVTGQASGQLGTNGSGSLQLVDSAGAVRMDATFSLDNAGGLQLSLSGQVPSTAPPNTAAGSTAQSQPSNHLLWYVARAAGLSAYLLLFLNVAFGLAVHTRFMDALIARWRSLDLHQFTALLAMAFLGLHVLSLLGDHYVGFTLTQLFVPLTSSYRPDSTALGIVALYLLVAVVASSYLRSQVSYRAWRAIHYLSFVAYVLALFHGIFSGTDTPELWARFLYWSTGTTVAVLMLWRFRSSERDAGSHETGKVGGRRPSAGMG